MVNFQANLKEKKMNARDKICLALDVNDITDARRLVTDVYPYVGCIKIGMEAFYSFGETILQGIKDNNDRRDTKMRVMLDLKLHDIPATVARAANVLASKYDFDLITAHCGDSPNALKKLAEFIPVEKIVGITVLTSVDPEGVHHYHGLMHPGGNDFNVDELIYRRVLSAYNNTGVSTFVCSGKDLPRLRAVLSCSVGTDNLKFITPGVRSLQPDDDQARVCTPRQAIENGSHMLVIGREIRDADDHMGAAQHIWRDVDEVLNGKVS